MSTALREEGIQLAKVELLYMDEQGLSCDKENAVKVVIKEFDNNGNLIRAMVSFDIKQLFG